METLSYKGYIGSLHYSKEDKTFWGKIEMICSLVAFEAENAAELEKAFQEAVDDYLTTCKEQGIAPRKTVQRGAQCKDTSRISQSGIRRSIEGGCIT